MVHVRTPSVSSKRYFYAHWSILDKKSADQPLDGKISFDGGRFQTLRTDQRRPPPEASSPVNHPSPAISARWLEHHACTGFDLRAAVTVGVIVDTDLGALFSERYTIGIAIDTDSAVLTGWPDKRSICFRHSVGGHFPVHAGQIPFISANNTPASLLNDSLRNTRC